MSDNITGERLEKLREERGYTKQRLSELMGMKTYTSITAWENGTNFPRGRELIKLAKLYNVSADYILGLSNSRK